MEKPDRSVDCEQCGFVSATPEIFFEQAALHEGMFYVICPRCGHWDKVKP